MPEARRKEAWPYPHLFESRISYIPTGGPLSLAPIENTFGAATALISRECFEELGGYSEIKGVGHEDYELFVRAAQAGCHIEICPIALYLYEVDRPSMISSTSPIRNFKRVVDAIDPLQNIEAWSDFTNLYAGKAALENGTNRSRYLRSKDPHAQLLESIDNADDLLTLLARLAEYAAALGATGAERAFRHASKLYLQQTATQSESPDTTDQHKISIRHFLGSRKTGITPSAAEAPSATVLFTSSPSEFALKVCKDLEREGFISSARLFDLRLLLDSKIPDDLAQNVLDSIARCDAVASDLPLVLEVVFLLAIQVNDLNAVTRSLKHLVAVDSELYRYAHVDVSHAIDTGSIPSALAHFAEHGMAEGRPGFERTRSVLEMLKQSKGWDLTLLQLAALGEGNDKIVPVLPR